MEMVERSVALSNRICRLYGRRNIFLGVKYRQFD